MRDAPLRGGGKPELDRGTWELLSALPQELSGDLLDMGCGYGPIGVAAGRRRAAPHRAQMRSTAE